MTNSLIVGIDVGGTYTDAVLLERTGEENARVLSLSKKATSDADPGGAIISAFDALFDGTRRCETSMVERVVVSTTLCTNAVLSGLLEPVALLIMPGPGLSIADFKLMAGIDGRVFDLAELRGYVDHRGREVEPLDPAEVDRLLREFRAAGFENLAVAGKFSVRNPAPEKRVARMARELDEFEHITMGHSLSGVLSFPRRAATACLNSAVASTFGAFVSSLGRAFAERGVTCPVMILKADAGTMDAETSGSMPVESILSGPAASVAGSLALAPGWGTGVSVDVGGTTTDVSFFVKGEPLLEAKGAEIAGRKTLVRAVYSRSLALGGDTPVSASEDAVFVGGSRRGAAAAFGGPGATLTDALVVAGFADAGDRSRSMTAIGREAERSGMNYARFAHCAVEQAVRRIVEFILRCLEALRGTPVYTVREVVDPVVFQPEVVVGIGAPPAAVTPLVASALGVGYVVPGLAAVGNAVGAALAVPTVEATVRIDTAAGFVTVVEDGMREETSGRIMREGDAEEITKRHVLRRAQWARERDVEIVEMESFNVVRDFHTSGRIFNVKAQVRPSRLRLCDSGEGAGPRV